MQTPPPQPPAIRPLVVSAPFGNYVQPRGTTPTLGTFTLLRRGGVASRIWRVFLTVRYYPRLKA
jgi:dihydroorotate dehydrogenase